MTPSFFIKQPSMRLTPQKRVRVSLNTESRSEEQRTTTPNELTDTTLRNTRALIRINRRWTWIVVRAEHEYCRGATHQITAGQKLPETPSYLVFHCRKTQGSMLPPTLRLPGSSVPQSAFRLTFVCANLLRRASVFFSS
jgi:hypothetical protein